MDRLSETRAVRRNYDKELTELIAGEEKSGSKPHLLLHSCCAPCSSSVLERLSPHFDITVLYYNPNIWPEEEYLFRKKEQISFIRRFPFAGNVDFLDCDYRAEEFEEAVLGLEREPERGGRCTVCYRLRLSEAARRAKELGCRYFCTTLSVSPLKDAARINAIGEEIAKRLGGVLWLPSDFKKKNGYLRGTQLSKEYGMYRQDYCGCRFSRK